MGKIFWEIYPCENFGYDVMYVCMSVRLPVQTVGVQVGRQKSLWGQENSGSFPWWEHFHPLACRLVAA